jgi:hypothetical protein
MDKPASRRSSIDPAHLVRIDRVTPLPGDDFPVVFVGAGNIMFGMLPVYVLLYHLMPSVGSPEGPWNHSFRFEQ